MTKTANKTIASTALTLAHPEFVRPLLGEAAWLTKLRSDAVAAFAATGFPARTDEDFKYTSLRPLTDLELKPQAAAHEGNEVDLALPLAVTELTAPGELTLVFRAGALVQGPKVLPVGVTVTPLWSALVTHEALLSRVLSAGITGGNAFSRLNAAYARDGFVLEVAPGVVAPRLKIVHLASGGQASAEFPRHVIMLGKNAQAEVVESFVGTGANAYFVNVVTDVELAEGAKLKHARLQREGTGAVHVGRLNAHVGRDAEFLTLSVSAGARLARIDLDLALVGSGARVELDGLYLVKGTQHVDHHTVVDHRVPDASSSQLYKGVLSSGARAVFNGKIIVRRDAQRTDARQLNRNLLLTTDCEVDTKPELLIDADDVKCSHGAAVGPLRPEQVFYLESRGLSQPEAIRLLSQGFVDEVLLRPAAQDLGARLRPLTKGYFA